MKEQILIIPKNPSWIHLLSFKVSADKKEFPFLEVLGYSEGCTGKISIKEMYRN